jgi:hypothetical protein
MSWKEVHKKVKTEDYSPSQRTLRQHVSRLGEDKSIFKEEKQSGRPRLLIGEQWEVVAGAILCCEEDVDLQWVMDFVEGSWGI